jgi:cell division protein FtsZ
MADDPISRLLGRWESDPQQPPMRHRLNEEALTTRRGSSGAREAAPPARSPDFTGSKEERMKEQLQDGRARIKVVGCGGGGGNAVNRMISASLRGVQFIAVNTDMQALERCQADTKVNIGRKLTRGLGSGGDWTKGRDAADESRTELSELLKDTDMVFITAGMGGGTGTGSSPVVAEIAKQEGALTIGVVTRPFNWEGKVRQDNAEEGIKLLKDKVDALIVIPNDRLAQVVDHKTTLEDAFRIADDVLRQGVQGIADLIVNPGVINLDFADVKAIMSDAGEALMGIGFGSGDTRAEDAAKQAVSSPLLETSIDGARGILFNITAGRDITLHEIQRAAQIVRASADPNANIIFGVVSDERMQGEVKITVIATGFVAAANRKKLEADVANYVQEPVATESRPQYLDDFDDINIPAFLRNRI